MQQYNSTSQLSGNSKKTAKQHLQQSEKGLLLKHTIISTSAYRIYGVPDVDTCGETLVKLFCVGQAQDALLPTSYTLEFHIKRTYYQAVNS